MGRASKVVLSFLCFLKRDQEPVPAGSHNLPGKLGRLSWRGWWWLELK